jgi:DNA polymerase alpha-associated DNA helicase A
MARLPRVDKKSLNARFKFAEDSFAGAAGGWDSQLRAATGIEDGERYLLRLFKKTGTPLDGDLGRLVARGLRRIRRVLSSRRARDLLVEVREVVEDRDELGILMLDPGSPVAGTPRAFRARHGLLLAGGARATFWRNIARVAEGLALCHDAGIVHGAVSEHAIFSHGDDRQDYRLGGYETCVHIGDADLGQSGQLLRPSGAISFRQDWIDLGRTAAAILGVSGDGGPSLLSIERRMLDRLSDPPRFQLFDGSVVVHDLKEVSVELDRLGASSEGELVLYPSGQVIQSDLPLLTSGAVPADDREAVLRFVEEDLLGPDVRAVAINRELVRIVTDLAAYRVRVIADCIGLLVRAEKRRPGDRVYDAVEVRHRLHLSRNLGSSEERVRKLGFGAKRWTDFNDLDQPGEAPRDVTPWYALIVLEVFTWLREQFRFYPVVVLPPSAGDEAGLAWLVLRDDADRDERRKLLGLRPASDALKRELRYDDGRAEWTVSKFATLAGERERLPELRYQGSGETDDQQAFAFTTNVALVPGASVYLRPRRDSGFERAIRRRLQNIVAARANVELLRALDDPAQVALDDALRDIAAPGVLPTDLDDSKKAAWQSISAGKSINVVVGPPGVGKTYLVSQLVKSILSVTSDARILVSAQNHETLVQMEDELRKTLPLEATVIVRIERPRSDHEASSLRQASAALLQSAAAARTDGEAVMANQRYQIKQALGPVDEAERAIADRVLRDTDNLLLRSSDVTLATTSSHVIEEMFSDGEQFDWVIVEEAARANGAELIGALLLGNRRVMIGDHNQLSPFDVVDRQKFYGAAFAAELLKDAKAQISTISDLPPEVEATLDLIKSDQLLLVDVLAAAARLEEAFRSIAEREADREKTTNRQSSIANVLLEQSRMHPALGELVSNVFYDRKLIPSERVKKRASTVTQDAGFPAAPLVILDMPSLSVVKEGAFEQQVKRSYRNETEAAALVSALKSLSPIRGEDGRLPTLAILSPYLAQVDHLERLLGQAADSERGTLFGFESPRRNRKFVYTSDSFQGGEADVVIASLVRNNVMVGTRALGFMKNPQRMNVLLSRAKQKLVLATSLQFIRNAVDGVDPDRRGGELGFLRTMLGEISRLAGAEFDGVGKGAAIIKVDERGGLLP